MKFVDIQYSCTVYFTAKTGKIITKELETL